jgi:hypothetical protein
MVTMVAPSVTVTLPVVGYVLNGGSTAVRVTVSVELETVTLRPGCWEFAE